MTLWTRSNCDLSSRAELEAFCIGDRPFSYTDNRSPGRPLSDALADGWKIVSQPIKDGKYWAWWFTREEK